MKIKANQVLFDRWLLLAEDVQHLRAVTQNDIDIDEPNISGWLACARRIQLGMARLISDTHNHLKGLR